MRAPYHDPHAHALMHASVWEDVAFYLWVASEVEGLVLELGCGGGRITLPLARLGCRVHGVDRSVPMLEVLERALQVEDDEVAERVSLQRGDLMDAAPPEPPALVLMSNRLVNHLDVPALQALAKRLGELAPGAILCLDAYLWDPSLLAEVVTTDSVRMVDPSTGRVPSLSSALTLEPESRMATTTLSWSEPLSSTSTLQQRLWKRRELLEVLADQGWKLRWEAADFEGYPCEEGDPAWVGMLIHTGDVQQARMSVPGLTVEHVEDWRRPPWRR